jgi:hypothetical protein
MYNRADDSAAEQFIKKKAVFPFFFVGITKIKTWSREIGKTAVGAGDVVKRLMLKKKKNVGESPQHQS